MPSLVVLSLATAPLFAACPSEGGGDGDLNFDAGKSQCDPGQYEGLNGACGEIPEGLEIISKDDLRDSASSDGAVDGSTVEQGLDAVDAATEEQPDANACVVWAVLPNGFRPVIGIQPLAGGTLGEPCTMSGFPLFHEFVVPSNNYVFALSDLTITTRIGCDFGGCSENPPLPQEFYQWTGNGGYRNDLGLVTYVGFAVSITE